MKWQINWTELNWTELNHAIVLDERLAWLGQILMIAAHSEEFASRGKKISNKFDIFNTASRDEFSP